MRSARSIRDALSARVASAAPSAPAASAGSSATADPSPALLWIIWLFWLFFLVQPLSQLLALPPSPQKAISLAGLALFVALYLWATWRNASRLSRETPAPAGSLWLEWGPIAALLVVGVAMTLLAGQSALGSLIYVSAALCGRLDARRAIIAVVGLALLAALLGVLIAAPLDAIFQIVFITPAVGSFVFFLDRAIRTNQELRRARLEIARLAVTKERLRFARDLHDLLGHTLSLITLKSELARRLISVAPEQAASEIGDIESAARQALMEVREAVSGYRQPTLQNELSGARELLAAAGIAWRQLGDKPNALSPSAEAALSWALREGVTNVIRHSRARTCSIIFAEGDGQRSIEIRDDGAAHPNHAEAEAATDADTAAGAHSAGLAGLRERVAALGGSCQAGAAPDGGWRLVVSLPLATAGAARTEEWTKERTASWFG